MYYFKTIKGHIEVYYNGKFLFSADTIEEAHEEVAKMIEE